MKTTKFVSYIFLITFAVLSLNVSAQDLPKGAITQINISDGPVNAIAYSRPVNQLAVATGKNIYIYDATTYKELTVLTGHTDLVLALVYSPNGKFLISGSSDKTTRSWDTDSGKHLRTHKKYTGPINAIAFSADGDQFMCGGNEHADIWYWYPTNLNTSGKTGSYMPGKTCTASVFSYTSIYVARAFDSATFLDDRLVTRLTQNGRKLEKSIVVVGSSDYGGFLTAHTDSVNVLTLHEKGKIFATGSGDKIIQLWDIIEINIEETKEPVHITNSKHLLSGHTGGISALDFSVNGKLLASGSSDKSVRLWGVTTGQHLHTFTGHTGDVGAVTFLGDKALAGTAFAKDRALASGCSDGTVILWDIDKVVSTQ